jgi:large subunit ribosomal protein L23
MGNTKRDQTLGYITKEEDKKLAYVTLPKDVKFEFPDLFPSDSDAKIKRRDDEKALDASKDGFKKYLERNKKRRGMPGWYSI